ncbi:MAG TPA: copper resistance CopC family protein [Candidatus Binataceae bacterium]|nr:copper resistance CopC family protein [Candidatus Binataceae bacterium]
MRPITSQTRICAALTVIIILLCADIAPVSAHSFPVEQRPAAGQKLAASPNSVTIRFDAPVEKLFAKMEVLDAAGKDHVVGAPEVSSNGLELSSKVASLPPGKYTVKWAVVCVDTHHTRGSYSFSIGGGGI